MNKFIYSLKSGWLILLVIIILIGGWFIFRQETFHLNNVQNVNGRGRMVVVTTERTNYNEGDNVTLTITNNLSEPIWHDNTCSIGPCSYYNEEFSCIRLVGINCKQSKLEAGEQIGLPYARPLGKNETQFAFFYIKDHSNPPFEYKEVVSNEITVNSETPLFSGKDCNDSRQCFFDSFSKCEPAQVRTVQNTIEGTSVYVYSSIKGHTIRGCQIYIYTDYSKDPFGGNNTKDYCYQLQQTTGEGPSNDYLIASQCEDQSRGDSRAI